ncbi:MAG: hypothetical protein H7X94_08600 [Vallitaleaceae bacterium]|nr:hypothetical protein [Vallitaleaceae bacterium]
MVMTSRERVRAVVNHQQGPFQWATHLRSSEKVFMDIVVIKNDSITKTLNAAKGCHLEIIFRDVYNLEGDTSKLGKAVNITRELIERYWQA